MGGGAELSWAEVEEWNWKRRGADLGGEGGVDLGGGGGAERSWEKEKEYNWRRRGAELGGGGGGGGVLGGGRGVELM